MCGLPLSSSNTLMINKEKKEDIEISQLGRAIIIRAHAESS